MYPVLHRHWRLLLAASALLTLAGGQIFPEPPDSGSFRVAVAQMLAGGRWVPANAMLLAGLMLATAGLLGLSTSGLTSRHGTLAARIAAFGAALSVLDSVFALAAISERHAAMMGAATPLLTTREVLEIVAYPVLGLAVAALAIAEAGRLGLAWRIASGAIAAGAVLYAAAGPAVYIARDQSLEWTYISGVALSTWFLAVAVLARRLRTSPSMGRSAAFELSRA